jgi:hypothetical protein
MGVMENHTVLHEMKTFALKRLHWPLLLLYWTLDAAAIQQWTTVDISTAD